MPRSSLRGPGHFFADQRPAENTVAGGNIGATRVRHVVTSSVSQRRPRQRIGMDTCNEIGLFRGLSGSIGIRLEQAVLTGSGDLPEPL